MTTPPSASQTAAAHRADVESGARFEFGKNWSHFLEHLDDDRIRIATEALQERLGVTSLEGKTFLDVGSGSGLMSLAARNLGATVRSFDYDPASVACTTELRRRYHPDDSAWTVTEGSVLDTSFLASLGTFDIVYSWGVLHHTGAMWRALENVIPLVAPGGRLFIAIYNDQGAISRRWTAIKRSYNRAPGPIRAAFLATATLYFEARGVAREVISGRFPRPIRSWREYSRSRGMSRWHDIVDWIGGYPFEVARPEQIFDFFRDRGFTLSRLVTCGGGLGCNEFVFERDQSAPA